jgi:glutamate dehydrogenase (NAD(P)+)
MEMTHTENPKAKNKIDRESLIKVLEEINVSAFLNGWGPINVIQIYNPDFNMQGILVLDNAILGPACGGIKISPMITPHQVFLNARRMTLSCALVNVNFGGAAAGIRANPFEVDKIKLIKSFAKGVSPYVPDQYITAPDIHVGKGEMAAFVEEIGDMRGATGKPEDMGGIPHELGVIGFGMGVAIEASIETVSSSSVLPSNISEVKIVVQGFDNIGCTVGKYLANKDAKIVAISDKWCTIYNPEGIDITKSLEYSSATTEKQSLKHSKMGKILPKEDIVKIDCDIFVPTTGNKMLTEENIGGQTLKCIVEGINNPITPIADQMLHNKGVLVLPDILTIAGGAISSYAEYNGNSCEMAFSLIESKIRDTTKMIIQNSLESGIPLRRVAKEIARERILQAMEET